MPNPYDPASDNGANLTRTIVNLPNDVEGTVKFVEDPVFRAKNVCAAKLRTLQFLYYVQHDLGYSDWSIANDMGFDAEPAPTENHCDLLDGFEHIERHFPVKPYVREGRRLVGVETLTGSDIYRNPAIGRTARTFENSIAVGYFHVELHRCDRPRDLEAGLDSIADLSPAETGAFEIPLGALIPRHLDGLVGSENTLSASRIASSAARQQPIAFSIGQAAGALSALAASQGVAPRAVDAKAVREALVKSAVQVDAPT
jgi:hypothetical protein